MINGNFVIVGMLLASIGTLGYAGDTLKGKIQPNRVSFFLWCFPPVIAFAAEISQGVRVQALMTLGLALGCILILTASFLNKKAVWKIRPFDLMCGAFSILGLIMWAITKVGNIAIIFAIFADFCASMPTVVKAYRFPKTEVGWPWFLFSFQGLVTILTINHWNIANYGYPLYVFIINLLICILVQFKVGKLSLKLRP